MKKFQQKLISFVGITICSMIGAKLVMGQPSPTPSYTYFPHQLICSEAFKANGPSIGLITIGKTTLQEIVNLYAPYFNVSVQKVDELRGTRIYFSQPADGSIYVAIDVCVLNDTIVASDGEFPTITVIEEMKHQTAMPQTLKAPITFELLGIKHFVSKYGIPDIITYTPEPTSRIAFWFKQGVAAEFYVVNDPTQYPPSFGRMIQVIYFPFQDVQNYENKWPFNQTFPEGRFSTGVAPFVSTDVPIERNPFDFDAIVATLTAIPNLTPTPISTLATLAAS